MTYIVSSGALNSTHSLTMQNEWRKNTNGSRKCSENKQTRKHETAQLSPVAPERIWKWGHRSGAKWGSTDPAQSAG